MYVIKLNASQRRKVDQLAGKAFRVEGIRAADAARREFLTETVVEALTVKGDLEKGFLSNVQLSEDGQHILYSLET